MMLANMALNSKAYNLIVRNVPKYEFDITGQDAIDHIPRLHVMAGCGISTMVHIIDVFKESGYDVHSWESELKSFCKTPSIQRKVNQIRGEMNYGL